MKTLTTEITNINLDIELDFNFYDGDAKVYNHEHYVSFEMNGEKYIGNFDIDCFYTIGYEEDERGRVAYWDVANIEVGILTNEIRIHHDDIDDIIEFDSKELQLIEDAIENYIIKLDQ